MANFVTDTDLNAAAFGLAHSMLIMCDRNGIGPDVIGLPDKMDVEVFRRTLEVDAELYMSMSPQHLVDEYDEIRAAASRMGPSSDPQDVVDRAKIDLEAIWQGSAADAFVVQLGRVQACVATQNEYTLVAARVKNPTQLADMAIDELLTLAGKSTQDKPVAGAEAVPVLNGYVEARDRLFTSYEQSLGTIRDWVRARANEYVALDKDILPEPLPASTDVHSPTFAYDDFFYLDHNPADHAPEVSRERDKHAAEHPEPHGAIGQRLAGDR